MNKKNVNKRKRYYFICSILTSIVFLAIGAYTIYAAIPSPGHGTSALEGDASLNMNSNKIINLTTPTAATDAATKAYVDTAPRVLACETFNVTAGVVNPATATCSTGYKLTGCSCGISSTYIHPSMSDTSCSCSHSSGPGLVARCCKIQ